MQDQENQQSSSTSSAKSLRIPELEDQGWHKTRVLSIKPARAGFMGFKRVLWVLSGFYGFKRVLWVL